MIGRVIVDTGPLIALIDRHDRHHAWVESQFADIVPPLLTCEAVLTQACYLAPRTGRGPTHPSGCSNGASFNWLLISPNNGPR
jgi:hypothetical protein